MTRRWLGTVLITVLACANGSAQDILINAAGATFPYPIYSKWFDAYRKQFPKLAFNYQSVGSGAGIRQITEGTVDFGATDSPMTEKQLQNFQAKRGGTVLHFPTVAGADVVTYNIPGVTQQLSFTPDVLAGIFLGRITKWNDHEIAVSNPGIPLPAANILVIHRSDGSGTTFVFTDYLSKVSKEWETKVGRNTSVNWPVGIGGKGNEGVAGQIKLLRNSIGYVELVYAVQNKMAYGKIRNLAGELVQPDLASVTAAAANAGRDMPDDFRLSITNAPGKTSYPISSFTWVLIPARIEDPAKREAIKSFLGWMLKDGQGMAEALNFARLPADLIARESKAIGKIH